MQADRTKEVMRGFEGRHRFDRARKAYEAWKAHYNASQVSEAEDAERKATYDDLISRTHARWDKIARAKVVALLRAGEA
jgi:multidrug resistance efflux pump